MPGAPGKRSLGPALLGGTPLRTAPFASRPFYDEQEVQAAVEVLRQGALSRFVGSPLPGTRDLLGRTSAELADSDASPSFLGGPNVRKFEAAWAAAHGAPYAVAMNSATSALTAALMAMHVGPGAEVITTPLSFTATATAIVAAHAVPVFADIDPDTLCLDPSSVERAISPRTRCIMPVHWCGNAGDFGAILALARRHGLPVLEDACQAPGTLYEGRFLGAHGNAGVFSFSEPKNVTTGEGGMVLTSDSEIARRCRLIRNHGEVVPSADDPDEFIADLVGCNFRMVEVLAALGRVQTSKLAQANRIRRNNHLHLVRRLTEELGASLRPQRITHPDSFGAYTAAFRWEERSGGLPRDTVAEALRAEGIPVSIGIGRLLCDHPLFRRKLAFGRAGCPFTCHAYDGRMDYSEVDVPNARRVHEQEYLAFFLCGWPNTEKDMDDIVAAFGKISAHREALRTHRAVGSTSATPA